MLGTVLGEVLLDAGSNTVTFLLSFKKLEKCDKINIEYRTCFNLGDFPELQC